LSVSAALLMAASMILALLLWLAVILSSDLYEQSHRGALGLPYWATIFGLWLNVLVVTAFAMCIAALSTVPALPLALGAAFAIACQSLGAVVQYLASGADGRQDLVANYSTPLHIAGWLLPDLSRLDWREWTMYDHTPAPGALSLSCLMAICYIGFMLMLAVLSFGRRDFD